MVEESYVNITDTSNTTVNLKTESGALFERCASRGCRLPSRWVLQGGNITVTVISISAVGTRGDAKGKVFVAKPDSSGRYVLNRKKPSGSSNPTNKAINKNYAGSLDEAADLLRTNNYLINLVSPDGKRALRELKKVRIETR